MACNKERAHRQKDRDSEAVSPDPSVGVHRAVWRAGASFRQRGAFRGLCDGRADRQGNLQQERRCAAASRVADQDDDAVHDLCRDRAGQDPAGQQGDGVVPRGRASALAGGPARGPADRAALPDPRRRGEVRERRGDRDRRRAGGVRIEVRRADDRDGAGAGDAEHELPQRQRPDDGRPLQLGPRPDHAGAAAILRFPAILQHLLAPHGGCGNCHRVQHQPSLPRQLSGRGRDQDGLHPGGGVQPDRLGAAWQQADHRDRPWRHVHRDAQRDDGAAAGYRVRQRPFTGAGDTTRGPGRSGRKETRGPDR